MYRRIGVLASLAVVAAMSIGVTSAQADASSGDNITCTFTGLSGQLSTPIPAFSKLQPLTAAGAYNFSGRANCSGVLGGRAVPPATDPVNGNATINSNGEFEDILCGTGLARDRWTGPGDTSTTVTPDDPTLPRGVDIGYEIRFAGGNGHLRVGADMGGHWQGSGAVHIQPQAPGNCATVDVEQFEVAGSFSAAHP